MARQNTRKTVINDNDWTSYYQLYILCNNVSHPYYHPRRQVLILSPLHRFFFFFLNKGLGVPIEAQQKQIWLGTMRVQVQSLASLHRSGIRCSHKLWYRSQVQLRSQVATAVAVVQASSCSSNLILSLGASIRLGCSSKKQHPPPPTPKKRRLKGAK